MSIQLHDIHVDFVQGRRRLAALDGVDLAVADGAFVSLIGPSGCGKSTLLNLIAGFLSPSQGSVLCNDRPVLGPGPDRAVVHQHTTALLPWLNVAENVGLGLKARRMARSERADIVARYLRLVGLEEFASAAIYNLSGGMQQRVALARALAVDSAVVLLDEPLGAIDALQRELMQDLLLRLWHETGRTFVLVTHSVEEAVYLSTEVIALSPRPGRIVVHETLDFGRRSLGGSGADIKATPEFVETSARLLKVLLSSRPAIRRADAA